MEKRIIFRQIILVSLAGCSNGSIVYKMDQQREGKANTTNPNTNQYYNSFWNNVNAGSSSSQAASNNNIVQFGNEARLNNVNMDMGAISSSATYVSNIFQPYNDHINGHARSSSSRNTCPDGMPGPSNSRAKITNMLTRGSIIQCPDGMPGSRNARAKITNMLTRDSITQCSDGMPRSLNVGMGTTNMLHSNSNTAVAVAQSAVYSSSCDHSTK